MSFSVIVPTCGRRTLGRTLESIHSQMVPGDELLVDANCDPWGDHARERMMAKATGTWLLFMDDDDVYASGALDLVRTAIEPERHAMHIFRMAYQDLGGRTLWTDREIHYGNVGTPMVVVPNIPAKLGRWSEFNHYGGDFDFIQSTARQMPVEWHEDVIAIVRPR